MFVMFHPRRLSVIGAGSPSALCLSRYHTEERNELQRVASISVPEIKVHTKERPPHDPISGRKEQTERAARAGGVNNTDTTTHDGEEKSGSATIANMLHLIICLCLGLRRFLRLELLQHVKGLVDLGIEGVLGADEGNELGIVHLKKHAGDLAGELRLLTKGKTNQRSLRSTQQPTLTAQS